MNFDQDWKYLFTSFDGRINREPFWAGVLVLVGANVVLAIIGSILSMIFGPLSYLATIGSLILIYPAVALYAKRWHDQAKSGWWTLIALVPLLGAIYTIYMLGIKEGEPAANQYGQNPLGGTVAA
ncbi:MAG: hypothetical protein JWR51_1377 [Devosia sp.]|uniref:DUF805 domain-containing protein n=1 Tax=Devosia sp. TaxID=1871048 RepID=UPI002633AA96|nr:DUF805 domain-containing protein [Devosia sp.]MDB5528274.1 hypothetical protein [Devosia sp.]